MPLRQDVLINEEIYHVYNRGSTGGDIFRRGDDYQRFLETVSFYRFRQLPFRLSKMLILSEKKRKKALDALVLKDDCLIEIYCFCLMPNHFHILLKQRTENGISKFVAQLQNSYTRFFNTKRHGMGYLFQGSFKAKRIVSEEQLIHLSRYVHLNPYSAFLVKSVDELSQYNYSSFSDYMNKKRFDFVNKKYIIDIFGNIEAYKKFVFDQADYQRRLAVIKSLLVD